MENLQLTLALQTPRHCEDMTELNSHFYYGLRLLLKCGHFHATQRNMALVFSLSIADT